MSQKRMFDRAIIDTDRFMDLGLPSKALYFLLGMEADDEGFVSYKKIMRIHGGNEDDFKVLIAKEFLIKFPSGVVVVTDWNKNNWLDTRRIKPTEYQKEKKLLMLNEDKVYCLANAKHSLSQYRVEESSIEENRVEQYRVEEKSLTPSQNNKSFFLGENSFKELLTEFYHGNDKSFIDSEFKKFILYWTEPNKSGTKVRWETEATFDVKRRLFTWFNRIKDYKAKDTNNKYQAKSINI